MQRICRDLHMHEQWTQSVRLFACAHLLLGNVSSFLGARMHLGCYRVPLPGFTSGSCKPLEAAVQPTVLRTWPCHTWHRRHPWYDLLRPWPASSRTMSMCLGHHAELPRLAQMSAGSWWPVLVTHMCRGGLTCSTAVPLCSLPAALWSSFTAPMLSLGGITVACPCTAQRADTSSGPGPAPAQGGAASPVTLSLTFSAAPCTEHGG